MFPLSFLFAVLILMVNFPLDVFAKVRCTPRFSYNLLLEIPPKPSNLLPTTKFFANDPVPLTALQDGNGKTVLRYLSGWPSP